MDLAPQAFSPTALPNTAALLEAPPPTSIPDLDRAAAALADRADAFARTPPREKAAILRRALPRILALAPEMVALACRAAGVDSASPLAGAAWLSGPVALLAGVRTFAEALEDIADNGRPILPVANLGTRSDGRVVARLEPRSFAERSRHRGSEAVAVFAEGVEPEDVIAGQAAFYRQSEPPGGVALLLAAGGPPSAAPLRALAALFVDGRVTLLETSPAQAWLGPLVERAFAPLIEAGFLRVVHGGDAPGAHLASTLGEPVAVSSGSGGPALVVPALYARDELWFIARRLASEIAAGAAFSIAAPRVIVLAGCWPQRRLFLEQLERALAELPPHGAPWTVVPDLAPDAEPPAGAVGVLTAGCDDPVEMLSAAVDRCNARSGDAASAEMVVHVVHEEDVEIAAALDRAAMRLRCGAVGVNQWPALLAFRGEPASRMLVQVDQTIVRGPLRTARRPAYFTDNPRAAELGARLAAFEAAPSVGRLLRS
jgi:hypothetical protein